MLKDLVLKNRSYRGFSQEPITMEQLKEIVSHARVCPSGNNRQPLKYILSASKEKNQSIFKHTKWAGSLSIKLPHEGKEPTAYIVICVDKTVNPNPDACGRDIGIVAQTMLLAATEMGFGGCMIGAFSPKNLHEELALDEKYHTSLILALGKPDDEIHIIDAQDGAVKYFRNEDDVHYVPKRPMEELIIEN